MPLGSGGSCLLRIEVRHSGVSIEGDSSLCFAWCFKQTSNLNLVPKKDTYGHTVDGPNPISHHMEAIAEIMGLLRYLRGNRIIEGFLKCRIASTHSRGTFQMDRVPVEQKRVPSKTKRETLYN